MPWSSIEVWLNGQGGWEVQGGVEKVALEVPESLQQLVEQQLRQLSPEDQRVLESASVTGMQFSAAAVAAGLEERVDTVEERCSTLARRGQFLQSSGIEEWPDGTVVGCYRFQPYAVSTGGIRSSAGGEAYPAPCPYWRTCGGRVSGAGCGACG